MAPAAKGPVSSKWPGYYRWTARRPPRELLLRILDHLDSEEKSRRKRTAVDLGFGAGTDTLELLRRGWSVLAIDAEPAAARFLARRVPRSRLGSLTVRTAPMEGLSLPRADLVYASFSLPFCDPVEFPRLWRSIRDALPPGGHFAGQLFGDRDAWAGRRRLSFHTAREVRTLTKGFRVELFRETEEEGQAYDGPKHWHFFELILEKARSR